jgi:hypothetical protein
MRVKFIKAGRRPASIPWTPVRIGTVAVLSLLAVNPPVHADPILLQTGVALGSVWQTMAAGILIEAVILALFLKRPFRQAALVCILANLITGFMGFVALLFVRMHGIPARPIGPTSLAAMLVEAPLIAIMLVRPPVKRVIAGVAAANMATALIAFAVLVPRAVSPGMPGSAEDMALARSMSIVQEAVDTYHQRYGYYPAWLAGGSRDCESSEEATEDPLIASGILGSYPPNPFAPYLRSQRFNMTFLLTGLGPATSPVSLEDPRDSWETEWFPLMRSDPRFGNPDRELLCANGLSENGADESHRTCEYRMNGTDYIPGCFFYKAYDFDGNGLADDYILGIFGWPSSPGTAIVDLIDGRTGEISLGIDSRGRVLPGHPDGMPEAILALHVQGAPAPTG